MISWFIVGKSRDLSSRRNMERPGRMDSFLFRNLMTYSTLLGSENEDADL